jgi:hypothetical protein
MLLDMPFDYVVNESHQEVAAEVGGGFLFEGSMP